MNEQRACIAPHSIRGINSLMQALGKLNMNINSKKNKSTKSRAYTSINMMTNTMIYSNTECMYCSTLKSRHHLSDAIMHPITDWVTAQVHALDSLKIPTAHALQFKVLPGAAPYICSTLAQTHHITSFQSSSHKIDISKI